ncbi:MAG: serine--tRNA ligase [Gammaproteobacteria bacterium]|nr:serine--tRNA ligase [Gammaproteobacteria bacterium]
MLDIQLFRHNIEETAALLLKKGYQLDIDKFNQIEQTRKSLQNEQQALQASRNKLSKEVGDLKRNKQDANSHLEELNIISENLKNVTDQFNSIYEEQKQLLSEMPNIASKDVPNGKDEHDNIEVKKHGEINPLNKESLDHVKIGESLGLYLSEEATKIAQSRFIVLKDKLARIHRGLAQMMLDIHVNEHGYTEYYVPQLVNLKAMYGTGQLPKFSDDQFILNDDNLALIPTAEVPLTNLVSDKILKADELPLKMVSHSACFRREAGSYGRDTRGMIRQHQFDKVEMVQIVDPLNGLDALNEMVSHAENILKALDLPYRVVELCTGDLGFSAFKTYDLEVWLPSQKTYREISSCSLCTDFQARRIKARYKNKAGDTNLVYTLNGSGVAVGRAMIALLENHYDGKHIHIPSALRPYVGGKDVI